MTSDKVWLESHNDMGYASYGCKLADEFVLPEALSIKTK